MEMEIICISSDDESDSQKENKKNKSVVNSTEIANASLVDEKIETLSSDDEKVEGNNLKRKILQINEKEKSPNNIEKKKIKLNTVQSTLKVIDKTVTKSGLYPISIPKMCSIDKSDSVMQLNKNQELIIKTPKLVVKEKKMISYVAYDVFPLFISLCLQKSQDDEKKDMEKIINKLKRRYEDLDPVYASSGRFVSFLNEKRVAIMNDSKKIYVHIEEVMNEMKRKSKIKSQALQNNEAYDAIPSTSYATKNLLVNNTADSDYYDDDQTNASPNTRKKIKKILFAMAKCEAVIKRLDEEEVDFEEENDSNYIKVEKYKQRMVELYNKLCEVTGENFDAGRVYLRPKHLNITRIVAVDQAITNFINSKITQRNQMKKKGNLTDNLIFPDYRDILECVSRCNEKKNLGLDKRRQEQMAKKAFIELGEHLQRTRRNDYWDTFSLYLENTEDDPAIKNKDLAKKLADNRSEGEKRLAAVFEKYTKKQEEMKEQDDDGTISEEESTIGDEDKNKDNLSIASLSEVDSDNEKNVDRTVEGNSLPVEKSKINTSTVNVCQSMDKVTSSETITDTSQEKCNKNVKIKVMKESDTAVAKNEDTTASERTVADKQICNNNTTAVVENIDTNTKMQKDSCSTAYSTVDCTSNINRTEEDLAEVITEDVPKVITDPITETVVKATDAMTRNVADVSPEEVTELVVEGVTEVITEEETEVITDVTEYIAIENVPNNVECDKQSEEEKKPLLRVRSFAKPPTTWEDNRHKADKTAQENAPKVANQIKEVVDLTSEVTTKPSPVVTKCAIQVGKKVIPIIKSQTLLIPQSKNIINVQNITNNYLKINPRTGQIIAPIRGTSTVIRVPSAQTTSQQNQPQTVATIRNEVPLTGNETVLRIIRQPNKPSPVAKKLTLQTISKQIDVRSSATKPK